MKKKRSTRKVRATFLKEGKGWVAWCGRYPGALTQGATIEEARANLVDAIGMIREPVDLSRVPKAHVRVEDLARKICRQLGIPDPK